MKQPFFKFVEFDNLHLDIDNEGSVVAGKKAIAKGIRELIKQPLLVIFLQCIILGPFLCDFGFFSIKILTLIQIGLKICFPLRKN